MPCTPRTRLTGCRAPDSLQDLPTPPPGQAPDPATAVTALQLQAYGPLVGRPHIHRLLMAFAYGLCLWPMLIWPCPSSPRMTPPVYVCVCVCVRERERERERDRAHVYTRTHARVSEIPHAPFHAHTHPAIHPPTQRHTDAHHHHQPPPEDETPGRCPAPTPPQCGLTHSISL